MSKEDICPHTTTERNNGDIVCTECGEVIDIDIRESAYNIGGSFNSQQSVQYIYPGDSLGYIGSLGSDMGNDKNLRDANKTFLKKKKYTDYKRLQKYAKLMHYPQYLSHKNSKNYKSNVSKGYSNSLQLELKLICKQLKINKSTTQNALYYLMKIINNEKVIINRVSLMGYCIYYATRQDGNHAPIRVEQIIQIFYEMGHRLKPSLLWRDELLYSKYFPKKKISKPIDYIYKYVADISNNIEVIKKLERKGYYKDKITFRQELEDMCKLMLDKLPKNHFRGCAPYNIAGAIIYSSGILLANKHDFTAKFLTQKSIHDSTGVLEYSIRDLYSKYIRPIFIKQKLKFISKRGMK